MEHTKVLVVEDDTSLRSALVRGMGQHGLQVEGVPDGGSALDLLSGREDTVDVVVLDIGLPDSDGRDVCQAIRAHGVTASVLFLTARGQVNDLVTGFAAGGDDYLAKPFHFDELLARVTALARRRVPSSPRPGGRPELDPRTHALLAGEERVRLTPTEYRILATLMGPPARVVRRRELVSAAWPPGAIVNDNTLDQYVARIRRKLAQLPAPAELVTVHGVGYRLG